MKVPFLDLKAAYAELQDRLEPAILSSFRSGWYILGPEVEAFEADFAALGAALGAAFGVVFSADLVVLALVFPTAS